MSTPFAISPLYPHRVFQTTRHDPKRFRFLWANKGKTRDVWGNAHIHQQGPFAFNLRYFNHLHAAMVFSSK